MEHRACVWEMAGKQPLVGGGGKPSGRGESARVYLLAAKGAWIESPVARFSIFCAFAQADEDHGTCFLVPKALGGDGGRGMRDIHVFSFLLLCRRWSLKSSMVHDVGFFFFRF